MVALTSIPVVIVDINTEDLDCFEQRNSFDMRQILFSAADKSELEIAFTDHVKDFFAKHVKEFAMKGKPDVKFSDLTSGYGPCNSY